MAKYNYEFKLKAVQEYLNGKGSYDYLSKKHNIPGTIFYSFEELKEAIERYIKYYNEKMIKEKLGWMSPVQYRLNTLDA